MPAFQQQYKAKPAQFIDTNGGRNVRAVKSQMLRKEKRASLFNESRHISDAREKVQQNEPQPTASKSEACALRLQSWKAEREMRKKLDLLKKKRPFLTGIVHHRLYSPISQNDCATGKSRQVRKPVKPATPQNHITRATEKRLLTEVCEQDKEQKIPKKQQSIPPINYKFKPLARLHHMQLFGHVDRQSMSPYRLGVSRKRYIPTKDIVMKNLNISIKDEERTTQDFQFLLNRERNRLNELCEEWAAIKDEPMIGEDGQYRIRQAIGQTNLLICKTFEIFRKLVTICETGNGKMLVTCNDLQGFWDMMYMEIKDCNTRFEKLEKLRMQGWKKEEPPVSKPDGKKKANTRKKKVVSMKDSSHRAFLQEKKKKISQETRDKDDTGALNRTNHKTLNNRTFDKIKISPSTKYRTRSTSGSVDLGNKRLIASNNGRLKSNLSLKVQVSCVKRTKLSLTVIKVNRMCKTLDIQLDTPMKTILKSSKTLIKVNVFLNEVPVDEEVHRKLDCIEDCFDLDSSNEEVPINSVKQLTFDDSSSKEGEDDHDAKEHSGLRNSVGDSTSRSTLHRSRL